MIEFQCQSKLIKIESTRIPSRELTYSVLGKGKSSSKRPLKGDMTPFPHFGHRQPPFWARLQKGSHGDAAEDLGLDMKSFAEVGTIWN